MRQKVAERIERERERDKRRRETVRAVESPPFVSASKLIKDCRIP
jgi:hypothetical protein